MNTEHLKIGNLVYDFENQDEYNYYPIEEIKKDEKGKYFVVYRNGSVKDYEPDFIPLSKEWLLKLGYVRSSRGTLGENDMIQKFVLRNVIEDTLNHEVHILTSTSNNKTTVRYRVSIGNDNPQHNYRIKYIHDLQNSFFEEAGFELTSIKIKLNKYNK